MTNSMSSGCAAIASAEGMVCRLGHRRLIPRPMRPVICKCPNHIGCLLGYRGDDIELTDDMARVCPECGTPVKLAPKPRNDLFYRVLNLIGLAALAGAIWFAWPSLVKLWQKGITPPPRTG